MTPTIDDLIALPHPTAVQCAPDARSAAYVVRSPDWDEDAFVTQIWVCGDDGPPRQLTFAPQSSHTPRWSPDGRWLLFVSQREGDSAAQLYRLAIAGGESERLSRHPTDVEEPAWSPDGKTIAFLAADPDSPAQARREKAFGKVRIEGEDETWTHVWVMDVATRAARRLTRGRDMHALDLAWSPDSRRIALVAAPTPDYADSDESRVYLVDPRSADVVPLTPPRHTSPVWSPDGARLACLFNHGHDCHNNQLRLWDPATGVSHDVAVALDEQYWIAAWKLAGLYVDAFERTAAHVYRIDPETGAVARIGGAGGVDPDAQEDPEHGGHRDPGADRAAERESDSQSDLAAHVDGVDGFVCHEVSFGTSSARAAVVAGTATRIADVAWLDVASGALRWLTDHQSAAAEWAIPKPEVWRWRSSDGVEVEGVLTRPPGDSDGGPRPLVVLLHGGPVAAATRIPLSISERRYYPTAHWLARGAYVLRPNYRGSAGYGEAFRSLNVRNLGLGDYADVVAGVDALVAAGWVDPERVAVMGWSQGGFIAMFAATYGDRFKAVSAGAGISNWTTYYANTDFHPFTRYYLEATPWDDPEVYRRTSPIGYIKQARTPTLIQHGARDRRVPVPSAYELYQGLRDVGVEVRLVTYPDMGHGPTKPRQCRHLMTDNLEWFNRWLFDALPDAAPKTCYVALAEDGWSAAPLAPPPGIAPDVAIAVVRSWSLRDRAAFRILSAGEGLKPSEEGVPASSADDSTPAAATAESVARLAALMAGQLRAEAWDKVTLYTGTTAAPSATKLAVGCLQVAVGLAGIDIEVEHVAVGDDGW